MFTLYDQCFAWFRQDDIDSGTSTSIVSIVAVSASPDAAGVTYSVASEVKLPQHPGIFILKELSSRTTDLGLFSTIVDTNDTLYFTITVNNTGNTWLSEVAVSDTLLGNIKCSPDVSDVESRFTPTDDSIVCTASVKVTQSMVDAGFMESATKVRVGMMIARQAEDNPVGTHHGLVCQI